MIKLQQLMKLKQMKQIKYIVYLVEDFKNINQRRAEFGLSTIEEYAKTIKGGIIPEEYYNENDE